MDPSSALYLKTLIYIPGCRPVSSLFQCRPHLPHYNTPSAFLHTQKPDRFPDLSCPVLFLFQASHWSLCLRLPVRGNLRPGQISRQKQRPPGWYLHSILLCRPFWEWFLQQTLVAFGSAIQTMIIWAFAPKPTV